MTWKPIWTDELIEDFLFMWRTGESPEEIREIIIDRCHQRAEREGRSTVDIPSLGGIIFKALEYGLIDENEYLDFRENLNLNRKPLPLKTKNEVLERDGYKCVNCESDKDLEIDHIKPVMMGGDNTLSNLQTLCYACHKIKGVNTLDLRTTPDIEYLLGKTGDGKQALLLDYHIKSDVHMQLIERAVRSFMPHYDVTRVYSGSVIACIAKETQ